MIHKKIASREPSKEKKKKSLKFVLWFLSMAIIFFVILPGFIIWLIGSGEAEELAKYKECECYRCSECEDLGDSEWIVVQGAVQAGSRPYKGLRTAKMLAKRQLLWCIEGMPLENGECLFNKIKDQPDLKDNFKILLNELAISKIIKSPDEGIQIMLRVSRKDVLKVFGLTDYSDGQDTPDSQ